MPFIAAKRSSGSGPARWRSGLRTRDAARRGRRARYEAWLLALRERAATAAIDRLLLDRRQAALRIGRADADAELDARGDDLVADGHDIARIDLAHDQDAAKLADDLAGRC